MLVTDFPPHHEGTFPSLVFASLIWENFPPPSEAWTVVKWKMEAAFYMAILTCLIFGNSGEWTCLRVLTHFSSRCQRRLCPLNSAWNEAEREPGLHPGQFSQRGWGGGIKGASSAHTVDVSLRKRTKGLLESCRRLGQLLKRHLYSRARGRSPEERFFFFNSLGHSPCFFPMRLWCCVFVYESERKKI